MEATAAEQTLTLEAEVVAPEETTPVDNSPNSNQSSNDNVNATEKAVIEFRDSGFVPAMVTDFFEHMVGERVRMQNDLDDIKKSFTRRADVVAKYKKQALEGEKELLRQLEKTGA